MLGERLSQKPWQKVSEACDSVFPNTAKVSLSLKNSSQNVLYPYKKTNQEEMLTRYEKIEG